MADHHIGGSQGGQSPKNILQQILDKIQEQSLEITALKQAQNTPTNQILNKIQEQSLKITALKHTQKTPAPTRNPSPNPAIYIKPEGSADPQDPQDPLNPPQKQKPLPDPEKFTGDRRDFRRWYFKISHKIKANRDTLGPLKTQFSYVYSQLRRAAQNMAIPFAKRASQIRQYNLNDLLNYLKKCYTDPNTNQKALEHLYRIRQGNNKPFVAFLPRFERELIKSDKTAWPDYFKISYLKGALNAKIINYLITINPDRQSYPDFIKVIQQTSLRLQVFNSTFPRGNRFNFGVNYKGHGGGNTIQ